MNDFPDIGQEYGAQVPDWKLERIQMMTSPSSVIISVVTEACGSPPQTVIRITEGFSNEVYAVTTLDGQQIIVGDPLRIASASKDLATSHGAPLGVEDLPLLAMAPPELQCDGFGNQATLLQDGIVAAGIVDGHMVAIATTSARTQRYANIAVTTLETWRNQSISSATASLVAAHPQRAGQVPVWSTGNDNYASQRVAEKLGFSREGERTYLITINHM